MKHTKSQSEPDLNAAEHSSKVRRAYISAFTLVELIVVITILAILGTVGFLSLQ